MQNVYACMCMYTVLGIVFPAQDVLFSRVCRTNHTPQSRERVRREGKLVGDWQRSLLSSLFNSSISSGEFLKSWILCFSFNKLTSPFFGICDTETKVRSFPLSCVSWEIKNQNFIGEFASFVSSHSVLESLFDVFVSMGFDVVLQFTHRIALEKVLFFINWEEQLG